MSVVLGCDFSSSPSRRKPIVLAWGKFRGDQVTLERLEPVCSLDGFVGRLSADGGWTGAFDLPFGLPRELVVHLGWPLQWEACIRHYAGLERSVIRDTFAAFCAQRPVGHKFARRACDEPAGSSPSMKWVNPPVALMLHAGVPRLLQAGVVLPGLYPDHWLQELDKPEVKIALEGYPGLVVREVIGRRSYKSDAPSKQTPDRLIARKDLVHALETGRTRHSIRVRMTHAQRDALVEDGSGDALDAVVCMLQAAWARQQFLAADRWHGLPPAMDALEGWIVSA